MNDQLRLKVSMNSFTYSHSLELLVLCSIFLSFVFVSTFHNIPFFNMILVVGSVVSIGYFSWISDYQAGASDAASSTLEFLIDEKILQPEAAEDDVLLKSNPDVVYFDKCNQCGEGWVGNPSATKRHNHDANR